MEPYDRLAPLYAQVKQRLSARLDADILKEGDFLPSEPDLCAELGVSRITLRRAVKELCDEGLLLRQQGRGTIVARRKLRQTLVSLSGFSEAFEGEGRVVHEVLEVTEEVRTPEALAALAATSATRIDRLIRVDDRPLTLESLYLDPDALGDVVAQVSRGASFFATLRSQGAPEPASAERVMNVSFPTASQRRLLAVNSTQPVYLVDKTMFAADGRPIAFSRLITPTHLITFSLRT